MRVDESSDARVRMRFNNSLDKGSKRFSGFICDIMIHLHFSLIFSA